MSENLEQWPHLNELVQCYKADWVKDENKYGHYESIPSISFQSQIFEGPDTDIETELRLANIRQGRNGDATDDDDPSTSGRHSSDTSSSEGTFPRTFQKHFGASPLPAYEPVFDWENERSLIFGQRTPDVPPTLCSSGLKISVKVLSLAFQAGFVEPFYGTICLYHREKREKLSEDIYFQFLPNEMQDGTVPSQHRAIFSLDSPSSSVYLLVQLEKPATEEGGVAPSVYSRKEPVHLTEREKQKLQVWARIMPYREAFAWAVVPLFESQVGGGVGGTASPSSPLAPSISGSSSQDSGLDLIGRTASDGRMTHYLSGSCVIVEIPNLNRVKESYIEELLQDPKRKIHKPIKGTLRMEVEKLKPTHLDTDTVSETGSISADSNDAGERFGDTGMLKSIGRSYNGSMKWNAHDGRDIVRSSSNNQGSMLEIGNDDIRALDFRTLTKNEPFSQLLHCLFLYPLTVSLSRKRNLFIRVELRKDDVDMRKPPLEVIYPKDGSLSFQKWTHTQVAVGTRTSCYHDEIKLCLPAIITSQHHLLFTFYHVDLLTKLEAPKPIPKSHCCGNIYPELAKESHLIKFDPDDLGWRTLDDESLVALDMIGTNSVITTADVPEESDGSELEEHDDIDEDEDPILSSGADFDD
ncbi:hypothetical protein KI387_038606 [Taxus chinensis]|uniref:C2 DOCK-type domain-containing protein n=1 Tax=Taxus chinensis TaxID=29808 RepID=A0AA38C9T8_TAXCH|nr:hypothetical protein KI387_038606 [Taxus chinensis]